MVARTTTVPNVDDVEREWKRSILLQPNWFGGSPDWMKVEEAAHTLLLKRGGPVVYANEVSWRAWHAQMAILQRYGPMLRKPEDQHRQLRRIVRRAMRAKKTDQP